MPVSEKVGISLKSLILVALMALSSVSPILIESALIDQTETDEKIVSFSNTGASQSSNNSTADSDGDGITDQDDNCPNGAFGWTSNASNDYDQDGCLDVSGWVTKILFGVNQSGDNSIIDMVIQDLSLIHI